VSTLVVATLVVAALPLAVACVYLFALTLLSAALPVPLPSSRRLRFDIVVPAHDEAAVIGRTVASLLTVDWPREAFRVLVVADNCSDATAQLARAAGADVIERRNLTRRGKGYALEYGFESSDRRGWADAIVVVDADTVVSSNLLAAFAARIERGAHAMQAHYGVLNPHDSWRTRLLAIAFAAFHTLRSRARERLGLSCGVRGNGWCVTRRLLRTVPYRAFSITEDLEYGIDLGIIGYRVQYAGEARVESEMVTSERIARSQRRRWEDGRLALLRSRLGSLLRTAVRARDPVCLDLALDLLVPPLAQLVAAVGALVIAVCIAALVLSSVRPLPVLAALCVGSLVCYVLRGWQLSGVGLRGLADLARAPAFLVWKLLLAREQRAPGEWVRTEREPR
jgi:cellulose synthase/poly-beta-1,6-N-acetylglucosamine synthase-like glycosyltransferase